MRKLPSSPASSKLLYMPPAGAAPSSIVPLSSESWLPALASRPGEGLLLAQWYWMPVRIR
jgi:hypothetical protein